MKHKVLIISPHFPPINAADHQRVRMALPFLEEFGWNPTILAVRPDCVDGVSDPLLAQTVPPQVPVRWARAIPSRFARSIGASSLAYRTIIYLALIGREMLSKQSFDLVLFSTTVFPVMALGPRWKRLFGVRYVLDFQDPWVSEYYSLHPGMRPPGGRLKYGFSQWLARRNEPRVVREADHVVCVSQAYSEMLQCRYPNVQAERFTTLPFGAPELDFRTLQNIPVSQSVFDPKDGKEHWIYIGRGGQDMAFALRAFFTALKRYADDHSNLSDRLHVYFIGTDYAPKERARRTIEPLALECGVDCLVTERTDRLPYFETLKCLTEADALIIPGSDDPGYTASKLYPYILAKKPLLAVFHQSSGVVDVLRRTKAGCVVTFDDKKGIAGVANEIYQQWFARWPIPAPATDWDAFIPFTARSMTKKLCAVFDWSISDGRET